MGELKLRLLFYNLSFTAYTSPLLMIIALATNYWLYSTEMIKEIKMAKATTTEYYTVPIQAMTTTNFLFNRNMLLTSATTPPLSLWSKPSFTLLTYNRNSYSSTKTPASNRSSFFNSSSSPANSSPVMPLANTKFTSIFKKKIEFALTSTSLAKSLSTNKTSTATMPTTTTTLETSSTKPPVDYIVAHYGLWRVCKIIDANKRLDCDYIKYFQGSDSENRITDTIKKQIGNCTIPILLSLLLMVISVGFHTYALFHRKLRYIFLLSGCLFIFAGLASLTGLVIFIATVNGAVDNKLTLNKSKEDEPPFVYHYDWSFFSAILSFLIQEINGISNIYWYIDYYRKYRFKIKEKQEKEKIARKLLKKRRKRSTTKLSTSSTFSSNSQLAASPKSRTKMLSVPPALPVPKIKVTGSANDIQKLDDEPHVLGKEDPAKRRNQSSPAPPPLPEPIDKAKEKKTSLSSGSNASSLGTKSYLNKIKEKTGGFFGPTKVTKSIVKDGAEAKADGTQSTNYPPPLPASIGFKLDNLFDPPSTALNMPDANKLVLENESKDREEKSTEAITDKAAEVDRRNSEEEKFSTPSQMPNDFLQQSEGDFKITRTSLDMALENYSPSTSKPQQPASSHKLYTVNFLKQKNRLKQQQKQEMQQMSTPERNALVNKMASEVQDEANLEEENLDPNNLAQEESEAMLNYGYAGGLNQLQQFPPSYYKMNQMVAHMYQSPSTSSGLSPAQLGMLHKSNMLPRSQSQFPTSEKYTHPNRVLPDYNDVMLKQQQQRMQMQASSNNQLLMIPDSSTMLATKNLIHDLNQLTSSTAGGSTSCASTTGSNSSSTSTSSSTTSYSGSSQSSTRSSTPTNLHGDFHQYFIHEGMPLDKRKHRMNSFKMKMPPFNTMISDEYTPEENSDSAHSSKHRHRHRHLQEPTSSMDEKPSHGRRRHHHERPDTLYKSNIEGEMTSSSDQAMAYFDDKDEADRLEFATLVSQFNENANNYEKLKYNMKHLDEDLTSDERNKAKGRYEFLRQLTSPDEFYQPHATSSASSHRLSEAAAQQSRNYLAKLPKSYYHSQDGAAYGYRSEVPYNMPLSLRLSKSNLQESDELRNARLANQTVSPIPPLTKEMLTTSTTTTTTTSVMKEHHQSSTYSPSLGASATTPTHHTLPIIHMDTKNPSVSSADSVRIKINTLGHDRSADVPKSSSQASPNATSSSQPPQPLLLIEKTFPVYNPQTSHPMSYTSLLQKTSPIVPNTMARNSSTRNDLYDVSYSQQRYFVDPYSGGHQHHHHHRHHQPYSQHVQQPPPPIQLVPSELNQSMLSASRSQRPVLQRASTSLDYKPVTRYMAGQELAYDNYPDYYEDPAGVAGTGYHTPYGDDPGYSFNYDNLEDQVVINPVRKLSKSTMGFAGHTSRRPEDQSSASTQPPFAKPPPERKSLKRTTSV